MKFEAKIPRALVKINLNTKTDLTASERQAGTGFGFCVFGVGGGALVSHQNAENVEILRKLTFSGRTKSTVCKYDKNIEQLNLVDYG